MTDRLLRRPEVRQKTGLSDNDIYRLMREGDFPRSVPLGRRTIAWLEFELDRWIEKRVADRDNGTAKRNRPGPGRGRKGPRDASTEAA